MFYTFIVSDGQGWYSIGFDAINEKQAREELERTVVLESWDHVRLVDERVES